MKKILLISNNGVGFYRFKKELVEELLSDGYEVAFSVPYDPLVDELIELGASYHPVTIDRRGMNPLKDITLLFQFIQVIGRACPSIIVFHTIKPNLYGSFIARFRNIPYINNITGLGSAFQKDSVLTKILRMMYRCSLKRSSGIFFENSGNLAYFEKYKIGNPERYYLVKGAGVNTAFYSCNKLERKALQENLVERVVFLFIGRIMREKGIAEYLDAAEFLIDQYQSAVTQVIPEFRVLGAYDEEDLKARIDALSKSGIIQYLGISGDTRKQMEEADCIVLPSYHEGMSNVLLEGASFGLPLITSNISGCKEAVEPGVNGYLCSPGDKDSLIQAIETFLALPPEKRSEMGEMGRKKMIKEFERSKVVKIYKDSIAEAIAKDCGKASKFLMKGALDRSLALILILGLSPVLLFISVLCRINLGKPVIFMQERPGLNGKPFKMYKFRTMTDAKNSDGSFLPDEKRLTDFGKMLRRTSLDELPELFNILRGDMSFVGPRPLLVRYLNRYSPEQARRHEVKPGLTGWAQVNGRNAISWEDKFKLDVWYVDHWSLCLDIKILWMTFFKVIKREGISSDGQATMEEFMGTKNAGNK